MKLSLHQNKGSDWYSLYAIRIGVQNKKRLNGGRNWIENVLWITKQIKENGIMYVSNKQNIQNYLLTGEPIMRFASAYYIPKDDAKEIVVFIDEPPSELPNNAVLIVETTDHAELSRTIEPYWLMVSG